MKPNPMKKLTLSLLAVIGLISFSGNIKAQNVTFDGQSYSITDIFTKISFSNVKWSDDSLMSGYFDYVTDADNSFLAVSSMDISTARLGVPFEFIYNVYGKTDTANNLGFDYNDKSSKIYEIYNYANFNTDTQIWLNISGVGSTAQLIRGFRGNLSALTDDGGQTLATLSFPNTGTVIASDGITSVPEPSTYALLGLGALALVVAYRRRVA